MIHIVTKNEKLRQNPNLGVSNARKKFLIGKIWPYLKYKNHRISRRVQMIDSILAVIVLIIAGWAIAKNYDAKVVLFIAALVLLYSGLLLGHNVLGAKATTGLSWVDPFKVIKDQFVRQYSNAGLIILTLFGFAAYMSHIGAYDMVIKVLTKPLSTSASRSS